MAGQDYTVREAAGLLGVSPRTVRRHLKSGKLEGERIEKGSSYVYVVRLDPAELGQVPDIVAANLMEMLREMQEENVRLAGQLGFVQAQLQAKETEVQLLTEGSRLPWWRRLVGR